MSNHKTRASTLPILTLFSLLLLLPVTLTQKCEVKNCLECKTTSTKECQKCESKYFISPKDSSCLECDTKCQDNHCKDNLGCDSCVQGYWVNKFTVDDDKKSYEMSNCLSDQMKTWLFSFWGILLVFILAPILLLVVVILAVICIFCRARKPRLYDEINNQDLKVR